VRLSLWALKKPFLYHYIYVVYDMLYDIGLLSAYNHYQYGRTDAGRCHFWCLWCLIPVGYIFRGFFSAPTTVPSSAEKFIWYIFCPRPLDVFNDDISTITTWNDDRKEYAQHIMSHILTGLGHGVVRLVRPDMHRWHRHTPKRYHVTHTLNIKTNTSEKQIMYHMKKYAKSDNVS